MFNKETEYTLRSLSYIYKKNQESITPGVREVAKAMNIPYHFTGKLLQRLVKAGLLQSHKGKKGGFSIDTLTAQLPIKELISKTEQNKMLDSCVFGFDTCNCNNPCPMHHAYIPVRDKIARFLTTQTIKKIAL